MTAPFHVGSAGYSACSATASPTPERTQRSGFFRKRRSSGISELSPQGGSEGYGACDDEVRVERCGKSAPDGWRLSVAVNSIRSNTGMGAGGPTPKAGPAAPGVAGAYRQRCVEIDDCQIQNPAYSLARTRRGPGESQGLFPIDTGTAARCTGRCSGGTAPGSERPDTARPPPGGRRRSAAPGPPTAPRGWLYWSPRAAPPHCSQMHVRFSRISSGTVSGQETACTSPSTIS